MIAISKFPDATVRASDAISKWGAVHNPIIFEFQRKDASVIKCIASDVFDGNVKVILGFPSEPTSVPWVVGEKIYINSGVYVGVFTIVALSGTTIIHISAAFDIDSAGGWVNFTETLSTWFLEVGVLGVVDSTYTKQGDNMRFVGDTSGLVRVNVSPRLRPLIKRIQDSFDYVTINERDLNLGQAYTIQFIEKNALFTASASTLTLDQLRYFIKAAKQLLDQYGGNVAEFVPFNLSSPELDNDLKAEFITDFDKPTYFIGYPFDLSFIYSENFNDVELIRNEDEFNVNGVATGGSSMATLDHKQSEAVNRLIARGNYASAVEEIDLWLTTGAALARGYADSGVGVGTGYVDPLYVEGGGGVDPIEPIEPAVS